MFVVILCCTNVQDLRSRARWQWRVVVNRYRGIVRLKMSAGRPPSEFWIKLRYGRDGLWPLQLSHGHRRGTKFIYNWIRTTEWGQRPVWCTAESAVVNTICSLYEYCTTLYQLKRLNGVEWVKHRQAYLFVGFFNNTLWTHRWMNLLTVLTALSCTMGTGSFPGVEAAGAWGWCPHPHLVPKVLEMSTAIPLLTLRACVAYIKKGEKQPTYGIRYTKKETG